jgi:hypothetical protein
VLESIQRGRGLERALDYAFYQVAAINGFDKFGHYLRARLILNTCSRYYIAPVDGCSSKFAGSNTQASSASAASAGDTDPILRRTTAALQGKDPDSAAPLPEMTATPQPKRKKPRAKAAPQPTATPAPAGAPPAYAAPAPTAVPEPQPSGNTNQGEAVLDYLFGKDAG